MKRLELFQQAVEASHEERLGDSPLWRLFAEVVDTPNDREKTAGALQKLRSRGYKKTADALHAWVESLGSSRPA